MKANLKLFGDLSSGSLVEGNQDDARLKIIEY